MYQTVGIGMWEYLKQFQPAAAMRFRQNTGSELLWSVHVRGAPPLGVCDALKFIHQSIFTPFDPRRVSFARSLSIKSIKTHYPWSYNTSLVHATSFVCAYVRVYVPP